MRYRLISFCLALTLSFGCFAVELYRWKDENGRIHFSDKPPPKEKIEKFNIKVKSYSGPATVSTHNVEAAVEDKVIIYLTEWCPYCKQAKDYMDSKAISYREYDIEKSKRAERAFKKLGGKGVPLILVGNMKMQGFNPGKLNNMINKNKRH